MYKDLADATESLKEDGYTHTFELGEESIVCKDLGKSYEPDEIKVRTSHKFDAGTDPGSEASIHSIETEDGEKGILITSYGMYVNKKKSALIDRLLKTK
jgi:hypothetical protein